jgi:hypothetical protein
MNSTEQPGSLQFLDNSWNRIARLVAHGLNRVLFYFAVIELYFTFVVITVIFNASPGKQPSIPALILTDAEFTISIWVLFYIIVANALWTYRADFHVRGLRLRAYVRARRWFLAIVVMLYAILFCLIGVTNASPPYFVPLEIASGALGVALVGVASVVLLNIASFGTNILVEAFTLTPRPRYSFSEDLFQTLARLASSSKVPIQNTSFLMVECQRVISNRLRNDFPTLRFGRLQSDFAVMQLCLKSGTDQERLFLGQMFTRISQFYAWNLHGVRVTSHSDEILHELGGFRQRLSRWETTRVENEITREVRAGLIATLEARQGLVLVILTSLLLIGTVVLVILSAFGLH